MDLEKLKIPELKELLGKMNLPKNGKKSDLIKRIEDNRMKPVEFKNNQPIVDHNLWIPTDNKEFLNFIEREYAEYELQPIDVEKDICNSQSTTRQLFDYQKFLIEYMRLHNKVGNEKAKSRGLMVYHGLGTGKCFQKDTPILMYDGSIKLIQDIHIGEKVMGDDSTPRNVLSTTSGKDTLYEIKPVKGESFTVNSKHILCLKQSNFGASLNIDKNCKNQKKIYQTHFINRETLKLNGKMFETKKEAEEFLKTQDMYFNISVEDFLNLSKKTQNQLKLFRTSIEFPETHINFDPYIIGLWLGDGSSGSSTITNQDSVIIKYLKETLPKYNLYLQYRSKYDYNIIGLSGKVGSNLFLNELKNQNLLNNKHIPNDYKINSRAIRLQVLAGLLDSDGHYHKGHFDIIQKNETLTNDIIYLCRSLGFAAYKKECKKGCWYKGDYKEAKYYRISISGHLDEIPTKIKRKQALPRKQVKDVLVTGFKVIEKGVDNYYGFMLDGNHKFLLNDFTVSHNSITTINMAEACRISGNQVRKVIVMIPATLRDEPWMKELSSALGPENIQSERDLPKNGWHILHYNNTTSFGSQLESLGSPNPFDNSVVIIDEVHNFINTIPRSEESIRSKIYQQMKTAKNAKFIFISGTPIMNTPFELAFIYNVLRGSTLFPEVEAEFMKLFFKDGKMINKNMFMRRINGLTSYYSGINESVFAKKRIQRINLTMTPTQTTNMLKVQEFEEKMQARKDNIPLGESRTDIQSQIKTMKRASALNARGTLAQALGIKSSPFTQTDDEETRIFTFSRANANISYPQEILAKYSKKNVEAIVDPKNYKKIVANLDFSKIKEYSPKFTTCIQLIKKSPGPVLVYSSFKEAYGINMLAETMNRYGFDEFGKNSTNSKYVLWTGDTKQEDKVKILKNFNDDKNTDGSIIKVILITEAGKEGINLRAVRQVHILEPWWNLNRVKQVIGRAVRICSHAHLPKQDRVVDIYQYFVDYPKGMKTKMPAPDILVEMVAKKKNKMEQEVLDVVKNSAIDCRLNKTHNQGVECADYSNFSDILFNEDITKDIPDIEDMDSFRRVEYQGKTYIMVRNNVYENKTTVELKRGIIPVFLGHAEIDLQGNITNIIGASTDKYIPVVINGRKFLKKGNTVYNFLSQIDIEKGLKPVRLFEEK